MSNVTKISSGEIVFRDLDELVQSLSKETGVSPDNVRAILRGSFASTREYIRLQSKKDVAAAIRRAIGEVAI